MSDQSDTSDQSDSDHEEITEFDEALDQLALLEHGHQQALQSLHWLQQNLSLIDDSLEECHVRALQQIEETGQCTFGQMICEWVHKI
jgi:hypothetical protein